jgi:nicotinamide mononucleotide transporter
MVSVVLTIKKNIWLWPTGIVGVVAFFFLFWEHHLYADMVLQFIFFALSIQGWIFWLSPSKNDDVPITTLSETERIQLYILCFGAIFFTTIALSKTDDVLPIWDASIMILSVAAQWLLAKKSFNNWNYWIIVNIISIYVYFSKGLNLTAIEYIIFLALCLLGRSQWQLKENNSQLEWF